MFQLKKIKAHNLNKQNKCGMYLLYVNPLLLCIVWMFFIQLHTSSSTPIKFFKNGKPWPILSVYSSQTIDYMHQIYLKFLVNVPAMVLCLQPQTNFSVHRHFKKIAIHTNLLPTYHFPKSLFLTSKLDGIIITTS